MRHAFLIILCFSLAAPATCAAAVDRNFTLTDPAWKVFIPANYQSRGSVADLLVHFHGDHAVFSAQTKAANLNTIVLTCNYGAVSSAYQNPFVNNTNLFQTIINEALFKVRQESDFSDTLQWDKLGVSSFSAGYGAVREILKQPAIYNDVDCMLLADTVYSSFTSTTDHTPDDSQMVNFRSFALAAKNGTKSLILTHSQVPTYTYCNTIETADDILSAISLSATAVNVTGPGGIHFYRTAQSGKFKLYGATGSDGASHLLHLQYDNQWLTQMPVAHVPEPGCFVLAIMLAGHITAIRRTRGTRKAFDKSWWR
jgi:hypothetical protein